MAVTQKIVSMLNRGHHPITHKSLLFRYYYPRVLSTFQPTCNIERAKAFLGPVKTWLAKTDDGKNQDCFFRSQLPVISDTV